MAKVKTLKYTIDDQEVKVDIHCSCKGVFSSAISQYWRQILNIDDKEGNSLAEIETEIKHKVEN